MGEDCGAVDPKCVGESVHRRSGLVLLDKVEYLLLRQTMLTLDRSRVLGVSVVFAAAVEGSFKESTEVMFRE